MISQQEHTVIHDFLKWYGIRHIEVYDELYDHIATSFENRDKLSQDIKTHIKEVVKPNLGMSDGIYRLIQTNNRAYERIIREKILNICKKYVFHWPEGIITLATITFCLILSKALETQHAFLISIFLSATLHLLGILSIFIFWIKAKRQKQPVKRSYKNHIIEGFMSKGFGIIFYSYIIVDLFIDVDWLELQTSDNSTFAAIALSITLMYALVSIQLVKEEFHYKLELA